MACNDIVSYDVSRKNDSCLQKLLFQKLARR
jgi:hypothetical protein